MAWFRKRRPDSVAPIDDRLDPSCAPPQPTNGFFAGLRIDLARIYHLRQVLWPTLLVAVLGYAYAITNPSVGVDDTAVEYYLLQGGLVPPGRFGSILVGFLLHIEGFRPVYSEALAVVFLIVGAFLWCVLMQRATHYALSPWAMAAFCAGLVSYPLINEIFIYNVSCVFVCLGYLLTALALLLLQYDSECVRPRRWLRMGSASLLVLLAVSMYESLAAVVLFGLFAVPFVRRLFSPDGGRNPRGFRTLYEGGIVIAVGIGGWFAIATLVRGLTHVAIPSYAADKVQWFIRPFDKVFYSLRMDTYVNYVLSGLYYLPIAMFVISALFGIGFCIARLFHPHGGLAWVHFAGMLLSVFALSIVQGLVTPYRANQTIGLFVAVILLTTVQHLLAHRTGRWLRVAGVVVVSLAIFWQASDLNKWFYVDSLRSQVETRTITEIMQKVQSQYGTTKPVVFTGSYSLPDSVQRYVMLPRDSVGGRAYLAYVAYDNPKSPLLTAKSVYLYKFNQVNGYSVLNWGVSAFYEPDREIVKYARMNGFNLADVTKAQYAQAKKYAAQMPGWPAAGSIVDRGAFVQVNLK